MYNKITQPLFFSFFILMMYLLCEFAVAGDTTRVSVRTNGTQGNSFSSYPSLSANGRWVAFSSEASNLVAGDTNGTLDVFVHDRQTHQTTRVSVDSAGVQGDGDSYYPNLSADGRWVAFVSLANNLVASDSNRQSDVFVHDRITHQTTRVSLNSAGVQGNGGSYYPSLSADGHLVAFMADASNLVAGDTNGASDVFIRNCLTHQTTRVSVDSVGAQGVGESFYPNLSADGRWVVFESEASNLVVGDTNGTLDIFVHDRLSHETTRVSVRSNGAQGNGFSYSSSLSADGHFVAFTSEASNLVGGDTNDVADIFVHDRLTHQTIRASVNSVGLQGNGESFYPSFSADGRFVAFKSAASNLVGGDTNNTWDVFIHNRLTHKTTRVSVGSSGQQGNDESNFPSLSADGRVVAFESYASNLVADDTNSTSDMFVRDRTFNPQFQGDLKIQAIQKPKSLVVGNQGSYTYTVTNQDQNANINVRVTHLVSNGTVLGFSPSQGVCRRYATISLCNLGRLSSGASLTLTIAVKAIRRNAVSQQVSVASSFVDPQPSNNFVKVETPVLP